jgi:hypothetical protein
MPKRTSEPAPVQTRAAEAQPLTAATKQALQPRPSEFALLSRVMANASEDEREFMLDFLERCAAGGYTIPEAALGESTAHFRFRIEPDEIEDHAKYYQGLTLVLLKRGWLQTFLGLILHLVLDGRRLTPEDVMDTLDNDMQQFDTNVDIAREILKEYPEIVAPEIKLALDAHPDLCAVTGGQHGN